MAYADIMAKVSHHRRFFMCIAVCIEVQASCTFIFFLSVHLELSYWWGRRRWRGNGGKCWGWDVLWGATVRTGNGRPGAGDQEHSGAVALDALSDLIIGALLHNHISLCPSVSLVLSRHLCLFSLGSVSSVCTLCFIRFEFLYLEAQSSNPGVSQSYKLLYAP